MKDSKLSKEKQEALHNVLSKIEKQYGEGSVMVDMISFSVSPSSVYTVGISHEVAQLPLLLTM